MKKFVMVVLLLVGTVLVVVPPVLCYQDGLLLTWRLVSLGVGAVLVFGNLASLFIDHMSEEDT
jgi:hypothetical protein